MAYKYTLKLDDFKIIMEVNTLEELIELSERLAGEEQQDGWISWGGGGCPVAEGTKIEVRFRRGETYETVYGPALCWNVDGYNSDIIAYRVVKD